MEVVISRAINKNDFENNVHWPKVSYSVDNTLTKLQLERAHNGPFSLLLI